MKEFHRFLNSSIPAAALSRRRSVNGDLFGLEFECEGANVGYDGSDDLEKDWRPHNDGSLRDIHGQCCEWIFNGPVAYQESVERVNSLFDFFEKRQARLVCSNRTSVHVHFNMGDKAVYQLLNMFILFTILEDLMGNYCGEDRNGNLFCLSSRHAEEQVKWVQDVCFKTHVFNYKDNNRYCAFNMASLNKFGTVEFRGMRGLDNKEDVLAWLDILNEFCIYSCYTMANPIHVIEQISVQTPSGFLRTVFSEKNVDRLTANLSLEDINSSIYEGLRLVQMLCYKIGNEFGHVKIRNRDFWHSLDNVKPEQKEDADELILRLLRENNQDIDHEEEEEYQDEHEEEEDEEEEEEDEEDAF